MKKFRIIIVIAFLALVFGECRSVFAQNDTSIEKIKEDVIALDVKRGEALKNKDFDFLNNLYADSWVYISPKGAKLVKDVYFNIIKSIEYKKLHYSEYSARVYGDTVVLNLVNEVEAVSPWGNIDEKISYTRVYVKDKDTWKFVSQQGTPIVE